jgi:putative effector of murein hydrolase
MKRSIPRLALKRETVRTLVATELARVVGGEETCTQVTGLMSGCSGEVHADSLLQNLLIK